MEPAVDSVTRSRRQTLFESILKSPDPKSANVTTANPPGVWIREVSVRYSGRNQNDCVSKRCSPTLDLVICNEIVLFLRSPAKLRSTDSKLPALNSLRTLLRSSSFSMLLQTY